MIKRLLRFLCRKPFYFDAFILILLLIFSHIIVSFHRRETLYELMQMPKYWVALGFTVCCALVVVTYIKLNNRRFARQYGIHDSILLRLEKQLLWNLLPPVIFVVLAVGIYFAWEKTSIFKRGYFANEFAFVWVGILCLLLLYGGFEVLRYLVNAADERHEFELFKAKVLSEEPIRPPAATTEEGQEDIPVNHYSLNQLLRVPLGSIGVIERRNAKNTIYTFDGGKYRLPMLKEGLAQFSSTHGFHWLSSYYGIHLSAIDYLTTGAHGSLLIALKENIQPVEQQQISWLPDKADSNKLRCYIKIHKNNASKVRDWYKRATA